jgi:hypothetical protein
MELRRQLAPLRFKSMLIAAIGVSFSATVSDLVIKILFDQRYHEAGWMAPVLITGTWVSILCLVNESTLLGLGRPNYSAFAYSLKFVWLLLGLPLSITYYGPVAAILVIATSDVLRYFPGLVGQIRLHFSFGLQDLLMTFVVFALLVIFEWLRWELGLGTSFESLPDFASFAASIVGK